MTTGNPTPYGNPFPSSPPSKLTTRKVCLLEMEREEQEEQEAMCVTANASSMNFTNFEDDELEQLDPQLNISASPSASSPLESTTNKRPFSNLDNDKEGHSSTAPPGDIQQLVETLKAQKRFKPQQAALLDEWVENENNTFARKLIMFGVQLEIHVAVTSLAASQLDDYKPSLAFRTNICKYTMGVMLAPCLLTYRGEVCYVVLDAMHELNITGVPDPKDEDKITAVLKEIPVYAIEFRNSTKLVITESIQAGDDIYKLAHQIIGMPNIRATVTTPVLIHVAFLRMVIAENASDTWLAVDRRMQEWEQADCEYHPTPEHHSPSEFPITLVKNVEEWELVCNCHTSTFIIPKIKKKKAKT
ncbi:hypothetical protein K439DRAFT_1624939 [Ramaria rubella]|nr:hypothetical protein K439DRAFT_1624939 [Ramaria rubella]